MRKSRYQLRKEKLKARCSAAGKKSQRVQAAKRMEDRDRVWQLVRLIEIRRADGSVSATWRVFATGEPGAPVAVDFGNEMHRYMSARRLGSLIAKKMFGVVQ
jgi:hypothetical protein